MKKHKLKELTSSPDDQYIRCVKSKLVYKIDSLIGTFDGRGSATESVLLIERKSKAKIAININELNNYSLYKLKNENSKENNNDTFLFLKEQHPEFFSNKPKPMTIGIHKDIKNRHPELSNNSISVALDHYTKHPLYLEQIIKNINQPRYNLELSATGSVSLRDSKGAIDRLKLVLCDFRDRYISQLGLSKINELERLTSPINKTTKELNDFIVIPRMDSIKFLSSDEERNLTSLLGKMRKGRANSRNMTIDEYLCVSDKSPLFDGLRILMSNHQH